MTERTNPPQCTCRLPSWYPDMVPGVVSVDDCPVHGEPATPSGLDALPPREDQDLLTAINFFNVSDQADAHERTDVLDLVDLFTEIRKDERLRMGQAKDFPDATVRKALAEAFQAGIEMGRRMEPVKHDEPAAFELAQLRVLLGATAGNIAAGALHRTEQAPDPLTCIHGMFHREPCEKCETEVQQTSDVKDKKPCTECGGRKWIEAGTLWESHNLGCSWSPLIQPAIGTWAMRDVERSADVKEKP